jgi:hypothetical protein
VLDYSYGDRITLDESALDESAGVCGDVAIDWNVNGLIDEGLVSRDINNTSGSLSILDDHDDWSSIVYDWDGTFAGGGASIPPSSQDAVACQNVPPAIP